MSGPLVSIITVNYNQSQITKELLLSLRKISYKAVEILVIDNGSPSDHPEKLREEFPEIQLIISNTNLGFAGGNNLGVQAANGKYCLFINNDTEVEPDFLEPLVQRFENQPEIGMLSPKIKFHHTPDTIQFAGYSPFHPVTLRQHLIGYRETDRGQHDESGPTFAGHGAAMMVPMKVIQEVGMMAELFFLYYEEHDWNERIKRAGYTAFYEARSIVWHKESISTGKDSPLKAYYLTRNRIVFARRNTRGFKKWLCLLYLFTLVPAKFTWSYLKKGQLDLLKAAWKGTLWNLTASRKSISKN